MVSAAISGSACGIFLELANARIAPRGGFEHLLFEQHLRGVLEALVLEQPLDQFAARIFGGVVGPGGRARQEHFALDVDEQRGGVDEIAGHIHVAGAELVDVGQKLRRDFGDGDVVDIDVLLADEVEQQIERAVVNLVHEDGKRRLLGVFAAGLTSFERGGNFFSRGALGLFGKGQRGRGVYGHGSRQRVG